MFYKYEFVKNKKLRELNFHFLYFMRKICNVKKTTKFVPTLFFHHTFLNSAGEIAPKGTINKDIKNKFTLFFNDFKKLNQNAKNEFYSLVVFSKDIHLYFEDINNKDVILLRNENIKRILNTDSFANLMDSLWKYLKSPNAWEIDEHYEKFYSKLPKSKMCPFCGLNEISNQELFKADYDHIAYKADYPFSAINLKNLAPSCSDCNRNFKKSKDVFYNKDNTRRVISYPYIFNNQFQNLNIEIDLTGSVIPDTDLNDIKGRWNINIMPANDFTFNWDNIYLIKSRYSLYINHDKWLEELTIHFKISKKKFNDISELKTYLSEYKDFFKDKLVVEYHLKYSYFKYLETSINEVLFNKIKMMCA